MKQVVKVFLAAAAVVALAAPAMAADKLIVKDAAGTTDVFVVDDTGKVLGNKLGMGTSSPQAPFHLNIGTQAVGNLLYSVSTGFLGSTQNNTFAADFTVADTSSTAGYRGTVRGVRARGSLEVPSAPSLDDYVFSVLGGVYTGYNNEVWNAADISMKVDGTVAHNTGGASVDAPIRITFNTRPKGYTWYERLTIKSNGNVGINSTSPTSKLQVVGLPVYTTNALAISGGLTAGAFYTDGAGNVKIVY